MFNKLLSMDSADLARGLVSLSAGNDAAALAYGATVVGATATIVMPASAMRSKVEATRRYGGEVVQTDGSLLDTCLALQRERGLTMVHPFDDLAVMARQGTVGLESSSRSRSPAWCWFRSEGAASSPASPRLSSCSTHPFAWWGSNPRGRMR